METPETETVFNIILQPLDMVLNLVYDNIIKPNIEVLYEAHKDGILKNESAKTEIKLLINNNSKYALSLLSKQYTKRLLQFYNHEGLAYYVYVHLNRVTMSYLEGLLSNN